MAYIPDMLAMGKAQQKASRLGQARLDGSPFTKPYEVPEVDMSLPAVVYWKSDGRDWSTDDPKILLKRPVQSKRDCRQYSITAYKPQRVEVYFDGEPDEWNEKR